MPSYSVEAPWYSDICATHHITNDPERLAIREKYQGREQIQTAGGSSMSIRRVGHSMIHTPTRALHIRNILHAPQATKHLLSVHLFTHDNNIFFEYHPYHFANKDTTKRIPLLHGRCIGGLYSLSFHDMNRALAALLSAHPTPELWHQRLGHPGTFALKHILHHNNLLVSSLNEDTSVCNACRMANSYQLSFPDSYNKTSSPLELVHNDVVGSAIRLSSGCRYYVSFIDDFNRFSRIYIIKNKSDVHQIFVKFQTHVERLLNKKILTIQRYWGGGYQRLNTHLKYVGI
jgi:hypothetical protein